MTTRTFSRTAWRRMREDVPVACSLVVKCVPLGSVTHSQMTASRGPIHNLQMLFDDVRAAEGKKPHGIVSFRIFIPLDGRLTALYGCGPAKYVYHFFLFFILLTTIKKTYM
jgi:hypothetical protein